MKTETELLKILADALNNLLSHRKRDGDWEDVRSTSLASWALSECLQSFEQDAHSITRFQRLIKETNEWISKRAKPDKPGKSWESEAWDTSLAVIALSYDDKVQSVHWGSQGMA